MKKSDCFKWIYHREVYELPRKIKKNVYGTKISKNKLRNEINKNSLKFCPSCRHKLFCQSTGNMTEYPEIWEYSSCRYCEFIIGGADNSLYTDIIMAAQDLFDNQKDEVEEHGSFKTLYSAVKYIGSNMRDYI